MIVDLRRRYLHRGARKSTLYRLLSWPLSVDGPEFYDSPSSSYCLHSEEEDAFMSHANCTSELDVYFAPPSYDRVRAVKITHP